MVVVALQNVVGAALVLAHAEAFRTDETLVDPLPVDVADKLTQLVLVRTVDNHVRFDVGNRGHISSGGSSGRLIKH